MATRIRLKRVGRKKQASYRIVVVDASTGPHGRSIERLGVYNPRTEPSLIRVDAARTLHWLQLGAEPSENVRALLRRAGVWQKWSRGVEPEELEEAVVTVGPAPGERKTSLRPKPAEGAATRVEAATGKPGEAEAHEPAATREEGAEAAAAEAPGAPEEETPETAAAEGVEAVEARAAEAEAPEAAVGAESPGEEDEGGGEEGAEKGDS